MLDMVDEDPERNGLGKGRVTDGEQSKVKSAKVCSGWVLVGVWADLRCPIIDALRFSKEKEFCIPINPYGLNWYIIACLKYENFAVVYFKF